MGVCGDKARTVVIESSKSPAPRGTPELNSRDQRILAHMYAFRITTNEAIHRLFFQRRTLDAAKAWVYRMRRHGYVESLTLFGRTKCHYLTKQSLRRLYGEYVESDLGPVIAQQMADAYARLWFCCLDDETRELVGTGDAFRQLSRSILPDASRRRNGRTDDLFHDTSTSPARLGCLLVDHAWTPEQVLERYDELVETKLADATCRSLASNRGGLIVAILTTWDGKARTIEDAIGDGNESVPYRTVVVPRLLDLV